MSITTITITLCFPVPVPILAGVKSGYPFECTPLHLRKRSIDLPYEKRGRFGKMDFL